MKVLGVNFFLKHSIVFLVIFGFIFTLFYRLTLQTICGVAFDKKCSISRPHRRDILTLYLTAVGCSNVNLVDASLFVRTLSHYAEEAYIPIYVQLARYIALALLSVYLSITLVDRWNGETHFYPCLVGTSF